MHRHTFRSITLLLTFAGFILLACDLGSLAAGKPTVVISSPPSGSQFREGEDIAIQSTSTDSSGVTRVELLVDGAVVRTDPVPAPQVSYPLIQTWKATAGKHTMSVRAFNSANAASDPAVVMITVAGAGGPAGGPTSIANAETPAIPTIVIPTLAPSTDLPGACTNNAAFVSDVTVPDGTILAGGQTFNKIWRLRNSGTCAWETGYQFVFVGGEAMTSSTSITVPSTAPGATADLLVPMTAPNSTGTHSGQWRMKAAGGSGFGTTVTVNIKVQSTPSPATSTPTRTPTRVPTCSGTPVIASFTATNTTITAGSSTTLQWGAVTNADSVDIDNSIGGVATPDDKAVSPTATTTYTMTAHCGANTTTRQVTITVTPSGSTTIVRCYIGSESGSVVGSGGSGNTPYPGGPTIAGDDGATNGWRAFFSFDIHDIAGKTIDVGNLNIGTPITSGHPFNLGHLWVGALDYGTLTVSDYSAAASGILELSSGPSGQYSIKSTVQSAATASKTRLKLRFWFSNESNGDAVPDSFQWTANTMCVTISYH